MSHNITPSTPTTKVKKTKTGAVAISASLDEHHAVALWNLSVLIVPDEQFWFAQALEIDYGAQGNTAEDAKKHFQKGLSATIHQHLKTYGNIDSLLSFAPREILREAAAKKSDIAHFGCVSFHEVLDAKAQAFIPFDGINYHILGKAA